MFLFVWKRHEVKERRKLPLEVLPELDFATLDSYAAICVANPGKLEG